MNLPNVCFYGRVSTDEQDTYDDQLTEVRAFCERHSEYLKLDENTLGFFARDVTGDRYFTNPTYLRMLDYLRLNPNIRYICVRHSSRLGRADPEVQQAELLRLRDEFRVQVLSATEPYLNPSFEQPQYDEWGDPVDPTAMVRVPLQAMTQMQNRQYRQQLGRESKKGVLRSLQTGRAHGGPPGLFFTRIDTGQLDSRHKKVYRIEPDPTTRHLHQQMFQYFVNSRSLSALADWLYQRGITTASGKRLSASTLFYRLRDYKFIGKLVYNRYLPKNSRTNPAGRKMRDRKYWKIIDNYCEPTVDEATFFEAQRVLSEGTVAISRTRLLTGILYCGVCGSRMTVNRGKGSSTAYRCMSRYQKHGKPCGNVEVSADEADSIVDTFVQEEILNGDFLRSFFTNELPHILSEHSDEAKKARCAIEEKIEKAQGELERLSSPEVIRLLGLEMMEELRVKREAELRSLRRRLASGHVSAREPGYENLTNFDALASALKAWWLNAPLTTKKALLRALIVRATVTRHSRQETPAMKLDLCVPVRQMTSDEPPSPPVPVTRERREWDSNPRCG